MEERSLAINSISKEIIRFAFILMIAMNGYQLFFIQVLSFYFAWSYTVALFFLPIFCYLLQRRLNSLSLNGMSSFRLVLYSMLMLWFASIAVGTVIYLLFYFKQAWFFTADALKEVPERSFFPTLTSYLYWYTIIGLPSALLARLVLYLKVKRRKK